MDVFFGEEQEYGWVNQKANMLILSGLTGSGRVFWE